MLGFVDAALQANTPQAAEPGAQTARRTSDATRITLRTMAGELGVAAMLTAITLQSGVFG